MKNKLGFILMTALWAAVTLTGCLGDRGNIDNGRDELFKPVEPGISIYNSAVQQNAAALQPAGVALRFAMLQAEAAKQEKLDKLDLIVVPNFGNVKTILFGSTTKITESAGVYTIAYGGGGGLPAYDNDNRTGEVQIDTRGVALSQTDEANPWLVTLASPMLTLDGGTRNVKLTSTGNMTIYREQEEYKIIFNRAASYIDRSIVAAWTGKFTFGSDKGATLIFSDLTDAEFHMTGSGSGASFWSLDGKKAVQMSYTLTKGAYEPSETGSMRIIGGEETGHLTESSEYTSEDFPSPNVKLKWAFKDGRLVYTVYYNGHTLEQVL